MITVIGIRLEGSQTAARGVDRISPLGGRNDIASVDRL